MIGAILKKLDDLGIANDTIVVYTTDNGPHQNAWPDAATTPFRSEKNTNWEGAFRVPAMIRWPGRIKPGSVANDIVSGLDWFPTLVAAAGEPDIKAQAAQGLPGRHKTFKVHLDGYNQLPYLTGQQPKSRARSSSTSTTTATSSPCATRTGRSSSRSSARQGTMRVWAEPFTTAARAETLRPARRPLRARGRHVEHLLRLVHVAALPRLRGAGGRGQFLATFKEFPPRQRPTASASTRSSRRCSARWKLRNPSNGRRRR